MPELTAYEVQTVENIADWLSIRASFPGVVIKKITSPFTKITRRIVPHSLILKTLHKTGDLAAHSAEAKLILKDAGVDSLEELKVRPLEFCDQLAAVYSIKAERAAMLDGIIAGLGGTATELLNLPLLIGAALRTITMIGHSYGYALQGDSARKYVVMILDLATIDEPERRQKMMKLLRVMESRLNSNPHDKLLPVDEITDSVTEDVELSLIEQLTMESIPLAGDLISMILDYDFMHHVDLTARNVFRERRLREAGLITNIRPNPISRRRRASTEVVEASGQIAYMFGYSLSFISSYPLFFGYDRFAKLTGFQRLRPSCHPSE